ncbi:MAG TPA: apolipoprotein N-acyltransferase [Acidimicrobiales bacterium]|nr:apolipoprotein N-acyltransferase [Acidimicrobiales bacterium]
MTAFGRLLRRARPAARSVRPIFSSRSRGRVARWGRIVLPSLLAGLGLSLSLPPFGLWVVAFPAAALLWWRLGGLGWKARLACGWVAGLGLFVPGLWWATSFNVYGGVVMMVVEALAPALACAAAPSARGRTLALTSGMVLVEALRGSWPFGGLPLGGLALGQASGPLAGAARLGGPLLLVALVWLGGCGLGSLAEVAVGLARHGDSDLLGQPWSPAGALLGGLVALAVVCGLAAWGAAAPDGGHAVSALRVATVQGGGRRGLSKAQVSAASVYRAQVEATAEIPRIDSDRPPSLILWPEDVVSLDDRLDSDPLKLALASMATDDRATLVVGVTEPVSSTAFRNEIVAFAPDGRIVSTYEKVHRVPFGEYVPYRGFFEHLADLSAVPLDAIAGHGDGLMRTPAGSLGAMVSYEVFFQERGRLPTRAGAELLVVPTNTSSYATSQVPCQEVAAARLQAIAEGRYLVQAAPTGFSSVVDNHGRVLERTSLGSRQVLLADVSLLDGRTLYERFGDLPVLAACGALVLVGWALALSRSSGLPSARRERWARSATARY